MATAERNGGAANEEDEPAGRIPWRANHFALQQLLAIGIDRNAAIKALYYTGNHSAEFAAAYVFDNPDADDELDASLFRESATEGLDCKMVLVVNGSLEMGVGETASQVAHATLVLYRLISASSDQNAIALLAAWEESGEKKIVVVGEDVGHLKQLEEYAFDRNIPTYLVHDAGRTGVPAGSATVLAVFGHEEDVNDITGRLPLL